jgi:hypothetical protein
VTAGVKNIMMDATKLYPNSYHPVNIWQSLDYHGLPKNYTRTECPPRYFLIDFGISQCYDPKDGLPLELPICGGDKTVPEFQGRGYYEPSNPFATDIYYLGNMIKEKFLNVRPSVFFTPEKVFTRTCVQANYGFDFMLPLVANMIQAEPLKRPTIDHIVAHALCSRKKLTCFASGATPSTFSEECESYCNISHLSRHQVCAHN